MAILIQILTALVAQIEAHPEIIGQIIAIVQDIVAICKANPTLAAEVVAMIKKAQEG